MSLSRPFDDLERYEREKSTRLRPDAIAVDQIYTLRIRWPFENDPPCHEFAVLIQAVIPTGDLYRVEIGWQPSDSVQLADFPLSRDAFVVTSLEDDAGENAVYEGAPYVDMGYFVGSIDPWDLALADLTQTLSHVAV